MAKDDFAALSPQQVNSWPIETPDTTNSGDTLAYAGSGEKGPFLALAQERFRICVDATEKQRAQSLEDLRFAAGIQWDKDIQNRRDAQHRPCLTINRIDGFLAHAVNSMRQQRPEVKVIATADGASEELAQVEEGLLRHIQVNSNADVAYDESFKDMCTGGIGWMRVVDDWASPTSMDQELFIRPIQNPFAVYYDPFCKLPDWSDGRFAFVVEDMTRAEFKKRYPNSEVAGLSDFRSIGDNAAYWFPGGNVRVAEYFHVEMKNEILCELEDKSTRLFSKLPKDMYSVHRGDDGSLGLYLNDSEGDEWGIGTYVGRARKCKIPEVYWAKITALDVLQERKWKGRYIPLIPVLGNQIELDGDRLLVGMVRYAREPQRMYNYMYTSFVETVALIPRAPWIAEVNQIPDGAMRDMWENFNTTPQVALFYKHIVDESGNPVPKPEMNVATPPIAAFVEGLQMADQNLKSVFRIFDASLGQRGPQESGLAINARKIESDTGIYNWNDNFIRALRYLGTVLEDLLPYYYNTEGREFQIVQEDDTTKQVVMNQDFQEQGQTKHYDLEQGGNYRILITTGPSYQTKRQEAAQSMIDFFKLYPAGLQACAHILVGEFDFPGKDKIKAQLEKILPPNLQAEDPNAPPIPPQFKAQMDAAMQQIQQLSQLLHAATDKNNAEMQKQLMKEYWETMREQMTQEVNLAVGALKAGNEQSMFLSEKIFEELNRIRAELAPQTTDTAVNGGAPSAPAGPAPAPQPSLAGPGTVAGTPSVGGV